MQTFRILYRDLASKNLRELIIEAVVNLEAIDLARDYLRVSCPRCQLIGIARAADPANLGVARG